MKGIFLILVLCLAGVSARAAETTYEVTAATTSLSEVALVLYGSAKMFRQIARWNDIAEPYFIHVGDELTLKIAPRRSAEEGLAKLSAIREQRTARVAALKSAPFKFRVVDDAATLSETAYLLYGHASYFEKIAEWNHIGAPYTIRVGQELALELKPTPGRAARLAKLQSEYEDDEQVAAAPESPDAMDARELASMQAEDLYDRGVAVWKAGDLEHALALFHRSRELREEYLPAWFHEIEALQSLNRSDDARRVSQSLVAKYPKMKDVPMLKGYVGEGGR